ncbi:MAG: flagellar basal body rod protein FlgB [Ignavibacteriae bacterium]|nr:flagellar basal body rod protein FlgB [Ignavibacteriota bacterium]NOG97130.1 flagellar basal body rod protein FlgB [Ignavibacteriota bacterium]
MAGSNIKLLENYIDFLSQKNKVVTKNISNIGTANYRREDVNFKNVLNSQMAAKLKTTDSKHLNITPNTSVPFETIVDKDDTMISGMNNVDMDAEMMSLAENSLKYKFASRKIGRYYKTLQKVINGRG